MKKLDLAICIMFNEKAEQTIDCVKSLNDLKSPIYLLNNGSSPECTQKVQKEVQKLDNVTYLVVDENIGVSKGRNYLLTHTDEKYLFFLDNDMKIIDAHSFWHNLTSSIFATDDDVLIVCPKIYNEHLSAFHEPHRFVLDGATITTQKATKYRSGCIATNYFPGGASIFKRQFFDKYGFYDENMFVGFEDYDLSFSAWKQQNFSDFVFELPTIEVNHNHLTPKTTEDKKALKTRYNPKLINHSYEHFVSKHPDFEFKIEYLEWLKQKIDTLTSD